MTNQAKVKVQKQQTCKSPSSYAIEIQTTAESPRGRTKYGTMHVEKGTCLNMAGCNLSCFARRCGDAQSSDIEE
jgi:hypothetical protein